MIYSWTIIERKEVTSTQDEIKALIRHEKLKTHTVLFSPKQTRGRGQYERSWFALPGDQFYASLYFSTKANSEFWPLINIAAAIALCQTLEDEFGLKPQMKWPNDVYIERKKISGILSESFRPTPQSEPGIILGLGLNLTGEPTDFPPELQSAATCLSQHTSRTIRGPHILDEFLKKFSKQLENIEQEPTRIQDAFQPRDFLKGKTIEAQSGNETIRGTAQGISSQGGLVIKTDEASLKTVFSATVKTQLGSEEKL